MVTDRWRLQRLLLHHQAKSRGIPLGIWWGGRAFFPTHKIKKSKLIFRLLTRIHIPFPTSVPRTLNPRFCVSISSDLNKYGVSILTYMDSYIDVPVPIVVLYERGISHNQR